VKGLEVLYAQVGGRKIQIESEKKEGRDAGSKI